MFYDIYAFKCCRKVFMWGKETLKHRVSQQQTNFVFSTVPSLILYGGRWTPQTFHLIIKSVNRGPCFICTMCSMKMWDHTSVKPSTLKERTGTRPGSMWSVSHSSKLDLEALPSRLTCLYYVETYSIFHIVGVFYFQLLQSGQRPSITR